MKSAYSFLPSVIAHRGSSAKAPENTLASLHLAGQQGAKWVEIDVLLSADGIPVIFHDDYLSRTTSGEGLIHKTSLKDLKKLDAGLWKDTKFQHERIPTLLEAITVIAEYGMGLNLELKPCEGLEDETVSASIAVLKENWPPHLPLLLSSFSYYALMNAKTLWPEVSRGYIVSAIPGNWQERMKHLGCGGLHINQSFFNIEQVHAVKAAGYKVLAFTVNDKEIAQKLLSHGVDAVFTDHPALLENCPLYSK